MEHPSQPDRLGGQVNPVQLLTRSSRVAFVEDQVQHLQHGGQSVPSVLGRWEDKPSASGLDLLFGPADPLTHGDFTDPISVGNLSGGQSAHGSQRQRDLGDRGQNRMAAQEQQRQAIVSNRFLPRSRGRLTGQLVLATLPKLLGAELVDHAAVADPDQPATGMVWNAVVGPLLRGGEQRFLDRVLGDVEVAESAHQRAEHLRRLGAQQVLELWRGGRHLPGGY
jgi:hypothetical protein